MIQNGDPAQLYFEVITVTFMTPKSNTNITFYLYGLKIIFLKNIQKLYPEFLSSCSPYTDSPSPPPHQPFHVAEYFFRMSSMSEGLWASLVTYCRNQTPKQVCNSQNPAATWSGFFLMIRSKDEYLPYWFW